MRQGGAAAQQPLAMQPLDRTDSVRVEVVRSIGACLRTVRVPARLEFPSQFGGTVNELLFAVDDVLGRRPDLYKVPWRAIIAARVISISSSTENRNIDPDRCPLRAISVSGPIIPRAIRPRTPTDSRAPATSRVVS